MTLEVDARPRRIDVAPGLIVDFLAATALFAGCERGMLERVAPHVYAVNVPAGVVIVRAGTTNPGIGVVYAGRAVVRNAGTIIEELAAGDAFGETGALLGTAQPHDVAAAIDSVILLVSHEVATQLATKVAAFSVAAARRIAARASTTPPFGAPSDAIPFVRVAAYNPTTEVVSALPAKLIQQHRILPLALRDRTLTVGMVDPTSAPARLELSRVLSTTHVAVVAISQDDFNDAYVRLRIDPVRGVRGARPSEPAVAPDALVFDHTDQEREAKHAGPIGDEIVALASRVIAHAIERGASDVHIDHSALGPRIRYRVQGQLYNWDHAILPGHARGLIARLKVLAGLDVTERRLPQDGRLGVRVGKREIDIRVSTIPTSRGEKIALRVFEAANILQPLETIFYDPPILEAMHVALQKPYGAIVVAGPTGSGKTSSLYAALAERVRTRPDTNVLTVEDPIEYRLGGVTQVQVNHAVDLGFAQVLRAMLRQDPDVIMVGEVRDESTAQLALEAAMTGHLMLTSVHANTAVGVVQRFEHLGCPRPLIGQSLALVLVQRLARRLCPRCTTVEVPPPIILANLAAHGLVERDREVALPRGMGCSECNQTGYRGRVAVVEMLALDDGLRAQIVAGASITVIERIAAEARMLYPFLRSAQNLMSKRMISPVEALLMLA